MIRRRKFNIENKGFKNLENMLINKTGANILDYDFLLSEAIETCIWKIKDVFGQIFNYDMNVLESEDEAEITEMGPCKGKTKRDNDWEVIEVSTNGILTGTEELFDCFEEIVPNIERNVIRPLTISDVELSTIDSSVDLSSRALSADIVLYFDAVDEDQLDRDLTINICFSKPTSAKPKEIPFSIKIRISTNLHHYDFYNS